MTAFYTHITAAVWIWLALMIVGHQAQQRRGPGETRELLVALGVMAALALPGLVRLARALTTPTNFYWLGQASPGLFVDTVADILLPVSGGVPGASGVALTVLVTIALALLTFRARHGLRRTIGRAPAVAAVVGALCALPLIIWLVGFAARPIFMPRTILIAAPGAALLIAAIVRAQPERRWREALSVGLPALFLASTLGGGVVRDKEDWRGAAEALARLAQPGDVLLVCADYTYPALRHAARSPLPIPVLLPGGDRPLLIERRFGGDPRWDRAVFRARSRPIAEIIETGTARVPLRPTAVELAAGSTAWLAVSECDPGERAAMEAWLGGSAWRSVWSDRATPDRPGVRLMAQRITAARSVPAKALVPEARRAD